MKQISRLLTILLSLPIISMAQSNYKPGSVVNLKGDTIRGFINYRGWDSNPDEVSFKSSLRDNETQKFGLNDITFFMVDGLAAYKKFTIAISMDETNTTRLEHGKDTTSRIGTVFLKVLQNGKNLALYGYADALKSRFYIGETPGYKPAELVYRIYNNYGGTGIDNTYQKQLFAFANKYNVLNDDLINTIQNAEYIESDLLLIVSRINKISKEEFKSKYSAPAKVEFYAGAGLNVVSYTADGNSPYGDGGGPGHLANGAVVMGGVSIIPNPGSDALEIRGDVAVGESSFYSQYQLTVEPYGEYKASFSQVDIAIYPSIIYHVYNAENFKFYLGAGVSAMYSHFSSPFFGPAGSNTSIAYVGSGGGYNYSFLGINTGFLLKGGFRIAKKYELFFNYVTRQPITHGGYFGFDAPRLQTGLIYHFGK